MSSPISKYTKIVSHSNFDMLPDENVKLYPNCDGKVWLRDCETEVTKPIDGVVRGNIPKWLNGTLLRNGPGRLQVGDMKYDHLFDSAALLHKFAIHNGDVTYQCRFVETNSFKKNLIAKRIVVTSYGSKTVPDPCHTIFQRIASVFCPDDDLDNTNISIYPMGDEFYTFTECPTIHRINIESLETEGKINISNFIGVINHTSHPHIMSDGTTYNIGLSLTNNQTQYNIIRFPKGEDMFKNATVVSKIPANWTFHPSYMHSFGITKNYFIVIEQPLSISLFGSIKAKCLKQPLVSIFKWFHNECTVLHVIHRQTGEVKQTFKTTAFFYLHVINAYEIKNYIVIDICCYKDPSVLDCMYVEAIANMQRMPNYAKMFKARPLRFILPLNENVKSKTNKRLNICNVWDTYSSSRKSTRLLKSLKQFRNIDYIFNEQNCDFIKRMHSNKTLGLGKNLIALKESKAEAYRLPDSTIYCVPELLCDLGCETPRINDKKKLGRNYRYFYAISSDVNASNPGTLIKVDVKNKAHWTWCEHNCYPSEPIFIPAPDSKNEDDGVILSAMIWGGSDQNRVGLLILCGKTFVELGRCEFMTPGPVPKCLHGWFVPTT